MISSDEFPTFQVRIPERSASRIATRTADAVSVSVLLAGTLTESRSMLGKVAESMSRHEAHDSGSQRTNARLPRRLRALVAVRDPSIMTGLHRLTDEVNMDPNESAHCWDGNADAWTKLARAGYDIYRDFLNTPAFFAMLPDVRGLRGIDIGCGEGSNTRLVAGRGARVIGVDVAPRFVEHALDAERRDPLGIEYRVGDAMALPFGVAAFEFAVAFMSLMDVPDPSRALGEAFRVLEPGGFLQFSISHPCTNTRHRRNLRDARGKTFAIEIGRYYERTDGHVDEWLFSAAPPEAKRGLPLFRVPTFHRTLAEWLNAVVGAGFAIERVEEPSASDDVVRRCPALQDTQQAPYFLDVRCRKPR